jgi:hypothetical protein
MSGRLRDRVEAEAQRLLRERVARLRQALEEGLDTLTQPLRLPLAPGEWGAVEGPAQLQAMRDATEAIARGTSQREVLTALVDAAAAFYPRAALFILKGASLAGWAGLGFLGDGGFSSADLPGIALPAAGSHLLARALGQRSLAHVGAEGPGRELVEALGGVTPGEAGAAPLLVRGRPVAVLYADSGPAGGPTTRGLPLDILARIAGLAMERISGAPDVRRAAPAGTGLLPGADLERAAGRGGAPRPGSPTPPEEAEVAALLSDLDGRPKREAGEDGLADEERRRHADARRFAHLLVSELLLYNEEAVIQGRKHRDLQERLKKEIDRSRQAYLARAAGLSRRGPDYFQEELIRQLAQGDSALLGG